MMGPMITARFFLALLLLAAPLGAEAQQTGKVYRVGFLWDRPAVWPHALEGFRQGLRDLGWVEGKNIVVEYRWPRATTIGSPAWRRNWSGLRSMSSLHQLPSTRGRPNERPRRFP